MPLRPAEAAFPLHAKAGHGIFNTEIGGYRDCPSEILQSYLEDHVAILVDFCLLLFMLVFWNSTENKSAKGIHPLLHLG